MARTTRTPTQKTCEVCSSKFTGETCPAPHRSSRIVPLASFSRLTCAKVICRNYTVNVPRTVALTRPYCPDHADDNNENELVWQDGKTNEIVSWDE